MVKVLKPVISVIIPVYNVERYLRLCVNSVLEQFFTNLELLLIDDGSIDNSGRICDEYAILDNRVRVFHRENAGVTSARLLGVDNAQGEYIVFVDSDDTIPKMSLYELFKVLKSENLDIVLGRWNKVTAKRSRAIPLLVNGIIDSETYIQYLLHDKCYCGPVGKIIKRKLFNKSTFDIPNSITNNEDLIMNLRLAVQADKIGIRPDIVAYNYYTRPGTASHRNMTMRQWEDVFREVDISVGQKYQLHFYAYVSRVLFTKCLFLDYSNSLYFKMIVEEKFKYKHDYRLCVYVEYLQNRRFIDKAMINVFKIGLQIRKLLFILLH